MSEPRLLFVVGCPRSGTTWLREMLAQHPQVVAAPSETAVFTLYLSRIDATWAAEARRTAPDKGYGIHSVLEPSEFDALLRSFADRVLDKAIPARPGCKVRVEKTPDHGKQAPLILRLYPEAYFLHVIRDPREVFCSFRGTRAWTSAFSDNPIEVARSWSAIVERALEIPALTSHYGEVHYERLLSDAPAELARLFEWLELDATPGLPAEIAARCQFDKMRHNHPNQPFFRRGEAEGWRGELTTSEVRRIEEIAGPLMERVGYRRSIPTGRFAPPRVWVRRRLERAHSVLERRLRGLIHRL